MKDKTLLILAAGMGSRYGGLKQIESFGPSGEFIIDYSIYDAIKAGFNKVVIIIKEETYDLFRKTIGKRIESKIKTEYVFQDLSNVPLKYKIPSTRVKPLGTAHAILCAKNVINEPFMIINADDYYGSVAFEDASKYMDSNTKNIGIIGYKVINTITENGSVKRGVITEKNGKLVDIVESSIAKVDNKIEATALKTNKKTIIEENCNVSMNMIAFLPSIFKYIEDNFEDFLKNSDLEKDEFLIPDIISKFNKEKKGEVEIIPTTAKWVGVTYKEDKKEVIDYINNQINAGVYKNDLWS